jgi:predicted metal-dependent phosphoesterase TrpH
MNGVAVLKRSLEKHNIKVIPGVEMTAEDEELGEVHILGYAIDTTHQPLRQELKHVMKRKRKQLKEMLDGLKEHGIEITMEEVHQEAGPGYVGRLALARLIVKKGGTPNTYKAFEQFLGEDGEVYTPVGIMDVHHAIDIIHNAGGYATFAHPTIEMLDTAVQRYVEAGLDGIEVYRPGASGNEELYAEMVADDFDLLKTGGSDWHGRHRDGHLGNYAVEESKILQFLNTVI